MVQPEPISFHSFVQPSLGINTVTDVGVGAGVTKAKIESRVLAKGVAGELGSSSGGLKQPQAEDLLPASGSAQ